MRAASLSALIWLAMFLGGIAGELPVYFHEAEQDATGTVWAVSRDKTTSVYAFENGEWKPLPLPEEGAKPVSLAKLNDGAVACVWRIANNHAIITRHLGAETKPIARGPLPIPKEDRDIRAPFVDSQDRLWFTDTAPEIYHANTSGTINLVHRLSAEDVTLPKKSGSRSSWKKFASIQATEDGKGRIWFWSRGVINSLWIKGAVVVDGDTVTRRSIPTEEDSHIRAIVKKDEQTFWIAKSGKGLFTYDVESGTLTPVLEPAERAFHFIHHIFQIDGEWHVAAAHPGDKPYSAPTLIWRKHKNSWLDLTPDPAESLGYRVRDHLDWVKTDEGVIFTTEFSAPLFVPKQGKSRLLDWRSGFLLRKPSHLFRLPNGHFLSWDNYRQMIDTPLTLPPRLAPSPRVFTLSGVRNWLLDANSKPWWISDSSKGDLFSWNQGKIETHPYPGGSIYDQSRLAYDTAGRFWLIPREPNQPIAFLDVKSQKWTEFSDAYTAFEACIDQPPAFDENHTDFLAPNYSADGKQIIFRAGEFIYHYADKKWSAISKEMIGVKNVGIPFFDPEDRISTVINYEIWQLDDGQWLNIGKEKRYPEVYQDSRRQLPDGRELSFPTSSVLDNEGTYWFTENRMLFKMRKGWDAKPVFPPKEFHPFITNTLMFRKVHLDAKGNAFIEPYESDYRIIISASEPRPKTTIAIKPFKDGRFQVTFDSKHATHIEWRLNDGPWQISEKKPRTLEKLPPGEHRLEAIGITAQLQPEVPAAVAVFNVEPKVSVQRPLQATEIVEEVKEPTPEAPAIPPLIADLHHSDYAKRTAAIATLSKYPEAALPALKAARATEEGDRRWWIDAAIQEIEK